MKLPSTNTKLLIWVGVTMLLLGWLLPFFIVLGIIPSTYFLNFLAYGVQLIGTITAMLGVYGIAKTRLDRKKTKDSPFLDDKPPTNLP